jgi:hypothetical protein
LKEGENMNRKSFHSLATSFVVAVAFSLGSVVAAHAAELTVKYTLTGATQSPVIKVPANTPVQLIGDQTVTGDIGVAQLVLHNVPSEGLQWAGVSSVETSGVNSYSGANGTRIVSLDYDGDVFLEVTVITPKTGPDSYGFIIVNAAGSHTGHVKLIY